MEKLDRRQFGHKSSFFRSAWVSYDTARAGLRLSADDGGDPIDPSPTVEQANGGLETRAIANSR
jgi:hypothetical protein